MFEGEFGRTECVAEGAFDGIPKDSRPLDFLPRRRSERTRRSVLSGGLWSFGL